jgi:hypothetical protein
MKMEEIKVGDVVYNGSGTNEATVKSFYYGDTTEKLATLKYIKSGLMVHEVKVSKLALVSKTGIRYYQGNQVKVLYEDGGYAVVKTIYNSVPIVVDRSQITDEAPYTVGVQFPGSDTIYHYLSKEGVLNVGDVIVIEHSHSRGVVVGTNTHSNKAIKWAKGVIVKRIPFG